MKTFVLNIILYVLLCTCIISCTFNSSKENKTIEVIGFHETNLEPNLSPCLLISFNGDLEKKKALVELMESAELKDFKVELINENYYKEGMYNNQNSKEDFKYGINYRIILNKESDKDIVNGLLTNKKIPFSINSNGFYLERNKNKTIQNVAFQNALLNAKSRIKAYADSSDMNFDIISIEEIDDYQLFPIDNIVYQDKMIKKLKVKAQLLPK